MPESLHVSLLTDGRDQVLTIPQEFALSGTEVVLRKDGNRLIIEPVADLAIEPVVLDSLVSLLATLPNISDNFPDVDEGLLPADDIML